MSNINDVARVAGVSPMTVSRYFNSPEALRPATREAVRKAIECLQYVPNAAARSLVRGKTNTIALILADITNPYFTTISRGVEDAAQRHGYTLILGNTDETPKKEEQYLTALVSRRVDGVILSQSHDGAGRLELLKRHGIPLVLIDRRVEGVAADVVTSDSYAGAVQLVRHLADQGVTEIAFIGGPPGISTLEERLQGYRDAMRDAGLEPAVHLGRYDRESGEAIMEMLAARGEIPRALIAANNLVAVGALATLRRRGLRVPEDVAIACFGEIEIAALIDPFLTVTAHPAYEIGRKAMELLFERIQGSRSEPREIVLPVQLIPRRSTRLRGDR